ncbi:flavodoxin reductase [Zhengella mangrovi]|uniref:Flavodoxin reductase n=1 Tax=Zhengella mangrovi TaxID=1982044 RepID=A0A2G1QU06_9HYPH|nr:flavodoxin reductase [Zhengella mangrovi]PHP68949.1 flavodoxin reductase [Zhengella mangrovi]
MRKAEILAIEPLTRDVHRFRLSRPDGFAYETGDATELALDRDGWRDEARPFTMTSLPDEDSLEFTIKRYPDHDGVTLRLHELLVGDAVLVGDPFETFRYRGQGVFIAGGAGFTPFLAILRGLKEKSALAGNTLVFANKTEADIICRDELDKMPGLEVVHVLSEERRSGMHHGMVDAELLREVTGGEFGQEFYLCGPPPMMEAVQDALDTVGVKPDSVSLDG